ncbi:hypothetical protein NKDENANG_03686 [Candidatus Entotheonellaceae bacterium PAL068K]
MTMPSLSRRLQQSWLWGGFRIWQRNRDAFRRSWKVEVGGIVIEPFIMLMAIGFGLGAYVSPIDGRSYAAFVTPGVIASYAMWHATFDATYGAYMRMTTNHLYEAYLSTPLETVNIVVGEVMWSATLSVMSSTTVLVAATAFGLVQSPLAILTLPVAYLIGTMFGAMAMIMTATAPTIGTLNNFFTLFILPMFYVSGVFFPLEGLPEALQRLAWLLPLTPATALTRSLVSGEITPLGLLCFLEVMIFTVAAFWFAVWLLKRRLIR